MKEKIKAEVAQIMDELKNIRDYLYENPEVGYLEKKASAILEENLKNHGFTVETGIYEINTAFRGTYDSGKKGPKIAFVCEYDALPRIGHGCGHNLIATMSLGAGIALKSVINEIGGSIVVLGTPAEETSGAKVKMVRGGEFEGITAVMMVHPSPLTEESGKSLALSALKFEYIGKTAHAAQAPEKGINALDSVILLFNGINAIRQHITSDVRIHGIISEGGLAANIVPERAVAEFYIRSETAEKNEEVIKKVVAIAQGAAIMTGATVKISNYETTYDNLRTNKILSDLFNNNLMELGEKEIRPPGDSLGSLDMGNVSHVVPAIHPWLGFGNKDLVPHTREFAAETISESGKQVLYRGACALAMTAYDIITSNDVQERMKNEFDKK
ncbi:MAG: M20 family metallopeptidase [Peptostreptococcaceae bacterium]|nr:M20 family metallopeptidase [Peptostreptococcaceae bacterium]